MFRGSRLLEKMKYHGYTADDLGTRTGVTGRSIDLYIKDKVCPSADTVEKLAIVFGIDQSFFFDGIDRDSGTPIQGS